MTERTRLIIAFVNLALVAIAAGTDNFYMWVLVAWINGFLIAKLKNQETNE